MSAFAVDGDLSRRAMALAEVIGVSACTLLVTAPAWAIVLTGTWRLAHVTLWLAALASLTLGPATVALLCTVRGVLHRRARSAHPVRVYASGLALGVRAWRSWLAGAAAVLLVGYHLTSATPTPLTTLAAAALAAVCALGGIAVASGTAATGEAAPGVGQRYCRAALRSPASLAVWMLLTPLLALTFLLPVLGPTIAFFAPGLWAAAVLVVNATFGFDDRALGSVRGLVTR